MIMSAALEKTRATVLPIYFVADESASMEPVIDELNSGLKELLDAMHLETMAAAKVRLTIIGFSNDARCYLDLADLREVSTMPEFTADGGTQYEAALTEIYHRVDADVDRLKAQGYQVNRPTVFFLTDGAPIDYPQRLWREALARLADPGFKRRPNLIAFGIGEARADIILELASKVDFAYVAAKSTSVGQAVADFCTVLVQSIVSSGNAAASGQAQVQVQRPHGFELAIDAVS